MSAVKTFRATLCGMILGLLFCGTARTADPWQELQTRFASPSAARATDAQTADPWKQLRAIYLPFTEEEEDAAMVDRRMTTKVAAALNGALAPHRHLIREASLLFDIPGEIVGAVIMVESGGRADAQASTSSAKGLMQTIDSTFRMARQNLAKRGIRIRKDPFDPRSSILAGCWYLDSMYRQVGRDTGDYASRQSIGSWRLPVEYYYAGPGNGRKKADVVIFYAGGRRVRIDKPAYSRKVMRWANIIAKGRG